MTIDDLCDLIRQRRKRTGLAWRNELKIRECETGCCPIIAAVNEVRGTDVLKGASNGDAETYAIATLGLYGWDARTVIASADSIIFGEIADVRAKLVAACTGPLE